MPNRLKLAGIAATAAHGVRGGAAANMPPQARWNRGDCGDCDFPQWFEGPPPQARWNRGDCGALSLAKETMRLSASSSLESRRLRLVKGGNVWHAVNRLKLAGIAATAATERTGRH